jgi:NADH dehydrogenase
MYPKLTFEDLDFRLIEAQRRILPEVSEAAAIKVMSSLERRGARICLNTQVVSATAGHVILSNGDEFDANLIVWTAGNAANPILARHTDLPVDERGYLLVRADLRVGTSNGPVPAAWGAGDNALVPDLSIDTTGAYTTANAQHAVRQGKLLAANIVASLRGKPLKNYMHKSLGVVATLGIGHGVFQSGGITITGFAAWLMHRGYHILAIPTWERKVRVAAVWLTAVFFGRDIASLMSAERPRKAFVAAGEPHSACSGQSATASPSVKAKLGSHRQDLLTATEVQTSLV